MEPTDLTVQILREIRDAIGQTNARLDQTNARLDQTNAQLDGTRDELRRALVESEMRTPTAIAAVAGTLSDIKELLSDRLQLRDRVDRVEREVELIKARLA
jgi:hypothetical protein